MTDEQPAYLVDYMLRIRGEEMRYQHDKQERAQGGPYGRVDVDERGV